MIKSINHSIYIILIGLMISGFSMAKAQNATPPSDTNDEKEYIRWVGEYSSKDKNSSKKGMLGRIGEFVFGKKPAVLVKPIAILADSNEKYWVLVKN